MNPKFVTTVAVVILMTSVAGWAKKTKAPVEKSATKTSNGLKIEDTKVGTGTEAKVGNTVTVHYTGTLTNGTQFDSSVDRGEPFKFRLGEGQVIKGWEEGVKGMKVGGKRKLTIPPEMAYGDRAMGVIKENSTLLFDIELLDVSK